MSDEKPTTPADETQRDIATAIACIAVHQDGTPRFEETVTNIRIALAAARADETQRERSALELLRNVMSIVDGDEMKGAMQCAWVHGWRVTPEVSTRNGAILDRARALLVTGQGGDNGG